MAIGPEDAAAKHNPQLDHIFHYTLKKKLSSSLNKFGKFQGP